jgi:glycosyltransferase involved in cell wall biosynthesis
MGRFGGLESFVLTLASDLASSDNFDIQVVFKKAGSFHLHDDLLAAIRECPAPVSFVQRSSFPLWKAIIKADLIHVQNPCPDVVFFSFLARKKLLINIINHTRGTASLHQKLWRFCLHFARRRFYISEFVRHTWERSAKPWPNSSVVFPICKLSSLKPLPPQQRRGFVFVARWIENKGLDTLVEAYANSGLDPYLWPLRLLGDGPLRPRILQRLHELGLAGYVDTPGFLDDEHKSELIRQSRFAVIPPATGEDFGLVAIEARHLGLPCLITLDGGVPEAAGVHSLRCPPADVPALTALLQQAAALSESAYQDLAEKAHTSLSAELVMPSFYADTYASMLR